MAPKAKSVLNRPGGSGTRGNSSGPGRPGGSGVRGSSTGGRAAAKGAAGPEVSVPSDANVAPGQAVEVAAPSDATLERPAELDAATLQSADLVLATAPEARHRLRLRFQYAADPTEAAKHFVMLLPKLRTHTHGHALCNDHGWRVEGASLRGKPIETFEFEHFVLANIPYSALPSLVVEHVFTSHNVRLEPRGESDCVPIGVPEITLAERLVALGERPSRAEKLRSLLEESGLARKDGERDVAYAIRLGKGLQSGFEHGVAAIDDTDDWVHLLPTLMLERGRGDSRALSAAFVYGLRAYGVPAHMILGLSFGGDINTDMGSAAACEAKSEFFADGVGWVPCDIGRKSLVNCRAKQERAPCRSFVPWHTATPSRAEANEASNIMRAASSDLQGVLLRVHKLCERKDIRPGTSLSSAELASIFGPALGVDADTAERRVTEVLQFCWQRGSGGAPLADGFAALELGSCPTHLGTGIGPCATGLAGVAFFEGGPYEDGVPLDLEALVETRLLLRAFRTGEVDAITGGLNEASKVATWRPRADVRGALWVDYEHTELPLIAVS
eukprot:TRINITY_DN23951_c0_g1_i2.p1 TRINITY_DN23951_c0_g1~~TRINITY_DN23951_c0_g1_i2.p1  ORF type:complete len:558 (-),score=82.02 TRINITY_DN23951_c0_g1_i2:8-1681(-)